MYAQAGITFMPLWILMTSADLGLLCYIVIPVINSTNHLSISTNMIIGNEPRDKQRDVFINLPTGFGKSLIYQALPLVFDAMHREGHIVVVISPLVSLMKDQVQKLKNLGISAITLSDIEEGDANAVEKGIFSVIYGSAEAFLKITRWRKMLTSEVYRKKLCAIAVDEARHKAVMLALTATATTSTRETITEMLLMDNPHVIYENPCKTNIAYSVHYMDKERLVGDCFQWLADELKEKKEKTTITIVYCQTIKQCCLIYSVLKGMHGRELYSNSADDPGHVLLEMLHSCTPVKNKDTVLYAFQKEESPVRVLVATIAFVMGVDCKGVHRTIHFGPSNNIEAYIQETGRSGRDGKQSVACLIYTDREFEDEFREDWNDLLNDESLFELAIENLSLSQLEASTCAELSCELHDESGKFEVPAAALDLLENISISE
ncbi:Bloom syndrome protein homolog [Stylophora pistillata]|uniref:Bloom syndrome protein homolog n=1 Tax=Stylophora pistillata TaxID=50429 RepID=UPI000C041A92|nr:Bloom syndrome protein homolog [Stylophora pistillata]